MWSSCVLVVIAFLFTRLTATAATSVPAELQKIVVFIFASDDTVHPEPLGTGFFVSVQDTSMYLVTSAHVLQEKTTGRYYKTIWLRVNTLQGGVNFSRLDLNAALPPFRQEDKNIFLHANSSVDLAVIPVWLNSADLDIKTLPAEKFIPKSKGEFSDLKISIGSDVFFTGLFTDFIGRARNYPIARFGHVALISDELIPWKEDRKPEVLAELYLIESTSFGGNSGSPTFFYLGSDRVPGALTVSAPELKLAGVVKGRFNEAALPNNNTAASIPFENVGISAVVPSYLLYDLLFGTELKELRAKRSANAPGK
jgi:hypothetical protein